MIDFILDLYEYMMYWVERVAPYFICFWLGYILAELIRL